MKVDPRNGTKPVLSHTRTSFLRVVLMSLDGITSEYSGLRRWNLWYFRLKEIVLDSTTNKNTLDTTNKNLRVETIHCLYFYGKMEIALNKNAWAKFECVMCLIFYGIYELRYRLFDNSKVLGSKSLNKIENDKCTNAKSISIKQLLSTFFQYIYIYIYMFLLLVQWEKK